LYMSLNYFMMRQDETRLGFYSSTL